MPDNRPTKKQRELLQFIDGFIRSNGYGPSYREIMRACDYKSVSTVAVHVDGLIARGFLVKKDNSARSLEVVTVAPHSTIETNPHEAWFVAEIAKRRESGATEAQKAEVDVLLKAAKVLGFRISPTKHAK